MLECDGKYLDMLHPSYFTKIGRIVKFPFMQNRRHVDENYVEFCMTHGEKDGRGKYGLPKPNLLASYKSTAKYGKPQPQPERLAMLKAYETMYNHFSPYVNGHRILSQEEAIAALDKSTAVGYPHNKKYKNKTEALEDPEFLEKVKQDWEVAMLQHDSWWIWTQSLKEEIRPLEKILANKIRTFTASPADLTINGNRLCLDFNEKMNAAHVKTASCVGLNVLNGGWHELWRKMDVFEDNYEQDFAEFDSSEFREILANCGQFRWETLHESDRTLENLVRYVCLFRNTIDSVMLMPDGNIVQKHTGQPSGDINTINNNTLVNFQCLAYAYFRKFPNNTPSDFERDVLAALVGDDNQTAVRKGVDFSVKDTIKYLAELYMTITTPCMEPRRAADCVFLSRTFTTIIDGKRVPVLDSNKMRASMRYSERSGDPAYSLIRANGFLNVCWGDKEMRDFIRRYIDWLVQKYDPVLKHTEDWRIAKAGTLKDWQLRQLWLFPREDYNYNQKFYEELSKAQRLIKEESFITLNLQRQIVNIKMPENATVKTAKRAAKKAAKTEVKREVRREKRKVRGKQPRVRLGAGYRNPAARAAADKTQISNVLMHGANTAYANNRRAIGNHARNRFGGKRPDPASMRIMETITLPKEAAPLRIGSLYGSDPSACASPFTRPAIQFDGTTATQTGFVFRSALRAAVLQQGITFVGTNSIGTAYAATQGLEIVPGGTAEFAPIAMQKVTSGGGPQPFPGVTQTGFDTNAMDLPKNAVHGDYLYPVVSGRADQKKGFYCEASQFLMINTVDEVPINVNVIVSRLDGNEWIAVKERGFGPALPGRATNMLAFNVTVSGYYAVTIVDEATPTNALITPATLDIYMTIMTTKGTGTINSIANPPDGVTVNQGFSFIFGHHSITDIEKNFKSIDSLRIIGTSFMWTNTAGAANRAGSNVGVQLPYGTHWLDYASYDKLVAAKKSHTFDSLEGMYGFLRPTQDTDLDFLQEFVVGDGIDGTGGELGLQTTRVVCEAQSDYLAISINNTTGLENRAGFYTIAHALEYTTNDQWRSVKQPQYKFSQLQKGIEVVADAPQWDLNDFHISDIWDWIKDAASTVYNGVKEVVSTVGPVVAAVAPLLL